MAAESLFSAAGMLVLPGWFLLIFFPRWKYSATTISAVVIPLLLSFLYTYLVITFTASSDGGYGSLAEVRTFFDNDYLLLAGWVHYLAFDLFIGSWVVRDAQSHDISHLAIVPCLVLLFMFGPIGLLGYLVIRGGWKRLWVLGVA